MYYKRSVRSINFSYSGVLNYVLKFAVVSTFDGTLGPSWQILFKFPPVFALLEDQLANSKILLESEFGLINVGPEIVQVPLSDLFGSEL